MRSVLSAYNPLGAHLLLPIFRDFTKGSRRWYNGNSVRAYAPDYESELEVFPTDSSPDSPRNVHLKTPIGVVYVRAAEPGDYHRYRAAFSKARPSLEVEHFNFAMFSKGSNDCELFYDITDRATHDLQELLATPRGRQLLDQYWNIVEIDHKLIYLPKTA